MISNIDEHDFDFFYIFKFVNQDNENLHSNSKRSFDDFKMKYRFMIDEMDIGYKI